MLNDINRILVRDCEARLEEYGDNYQGVGWTKGQQYADARYRVMLDIISPDNSDEVTLLDFGCGASHLYRYMLDHSIGNVTYSGLDLSDRFLELSRNKFPQVPYYRVDILKSEDELPQFDYIVLNGLFTYKGELPYPDMVEYFHAMIAKVFPKARVGIAFNVTTKHVDWEREDLFHVPFDSLAAFLSTHISKRFVFRQDYGLYEYTAYVYQEP